MVVLVSVIKALPLDTLVQTKQVLKAPHSPTKIRLVLYVGIHYSRARAACGLQGNFVRPVKLNAFIHID